MMRYDTEKERHEAKLLSKRIWRKRNKDRVRSYNRQYYTARKRALTSGGFEVPEKPDHEFLVKNWKKIKRDLDSLTKTQTAKNWNISRRTLGRLIEEMENEQ